VTFLLKTYIDSIRFDTTADVPVTMKEVPISSATLGEHGTDGHSAPGDIYGYVYGEPNSKRGYFPGDYTRLGEVSPLLSATDDKFVIYGGGDELALRFDDPSPRPEGMNRRYMVYVNGYYKDTNNDVAKTVEPLPFAAMSNFPYPSGEHYPDDPEHVVYRRTWNTRTPVEPPAPAPEQPSLIQSALGAVQRTVSAVWTAVSEAFGATRGQAVVADEPAVQRSLNTDMVSLDLTSDQGGGAGCKACHATHGAAESGAALPGGRAASDGRACTTDGNGGCHDSAANSASGIDIRARFTASTNPLAHHDVMSADQQTTGARVACADCHDPHTNTASARYSSPDAPSVSLSSSLESIIASTGAVYVLVGGDHDGVGPAISNIVLNASGGLYTSPVVTWTTNERATSWIDWGFTTSYELGNDASGVPFGNYDLVTSHTVSMTGLLAGMTYHYRVRTVDALGNVSVSADRTYMVVAPPSIPVMSDVTTVDGPGWGPVSATVTCTPVASSDGDAVQYQFMLDGAALTGWYGTASGVVGDLYSGAHSVQVRARDAVHTDSVSGWSAADGFMVQYADYPGSCPFLFTWNGERFVYEADVFTTGKLASQRSTGYEKPNPNDYYVLDNMPQAKDGSPELRLVEERFETDYLDTLKLYTLDVPADRDVFAEKLPQGGAYEPAEQVLHTVSKQLQTAQSAHIVSTGQDVADDIAKSGDGKYAVLSPDQEKPSYQSIELDLGDLRDAPSKKLIIEGMTRFPKTDAGKALGSVGARQKIEVPDANGNWVEVKMPLPKPAEFARPYVVDVSNAFLTDDYRVRVTFLLKTYIDSIRFDTTADLPITMTEVPLASAMLGQHGMDGRSSDGDIFEFVYGEPNGDRGYFPGNYTRLGEVSPLLGGTDDKFAIFGGGDELTLRFGSPAPQPEGTNRRYMLYVNGYYKDTNNNVAKTVEPLPFSAMSNYPYTTAEHYPDDADHAAYQQTWNTRVEVQAPAPAPAQPTGLFDSALGAVKRTVTAMVDAVAGVFGQPRMDVAAASVTQSEDAYSVDSDYAALNILKSDGSLATATVAAGWETAAIEAAKPTPSAPGSAVAPSVIASLSVDDGSYWRTGLATGDHQWNWQLMRFDLGSAALRETAGLTLTWNGHGEPTPGYPSAVYYWDPNASVWRQIDRSQMSSDKTVGYGSSALATSFCLSCHDGAPPAGVVFPAGTTAVGPGWGSSTGDFHGARPGIGYGLGGLKNPYMRGQQAIACTICHDTHGNANLYHIPANVNGSTGLSIPNGAASKQLCESCHSGDANSWHKYCIDCHSDPSGHDTPWLDFNTGGYDCVSCHRHSGTWTHPSAPGCHCAPGDVWRTF
jgi:hypothetical protein